MSLAQQLWQQFTQTTVGCSFCNIDNIIEYSDKQIETSTIPYEECKRSSTLLTLLYSSSAIICIDANKWKWCHTNTNKFSDKLPFPVEKIIHTVYLRTLKSTWVFKLVLILVEHAFIPIQLKVLATDFNQAKLIRPTHKRETVNSERNWEKLNIYSCSVLYEFK